MDDSLKSLSIDPVALPSTFDTAARRQLLRSMGGALAGLAAGMALCPREALAETRPTLTSLDARLTNLEQRQTQTENALDAAITALMAPPILWKGRSFTGSGYTMAPPGTFTTYVPNVTEANTSQDDLSHTNGVFSVLRGGYYSVAWSLWSAAPSGEAHYQFRVNDTVVESRLKAFVDHHPFTLTTVLALAAGDALKAGVHCVGAGPSPVWWSGGGGPGDVGQNIVIWRIGNP